VRLVGYYKVIYYDAWSHECKLHQLYIPSVHIFNNKSLLFELFSLVGYYAA